MSTAHHDPGTFCWFECATRDVEGAKRFYTQLFGWEAVDQPMPGEMPGVYTLLQMEGADVAGMYPMQGEMFEGMPPNWSTYVTVVDPDATAARAAALGGQVLAPPMDVPGVGRIAVLADPTGASIGIFRPGEHPGAAQQGPVHGTFGWSELHTSDTRAASTFYTQLFDWKAKADDGAFPYTEFQVGKRSIAGMMQQKAEMKGTPSCWIPYVMVDDCRKSAEKVRELGGKIFVPRTHIPGVGHFAMFADPTGATLAIIQLEEGA